MPAAADLGAEQDVSGPHGAGEEGVEDAGGVEVAAFESEQADAEGGQEGPDEVAGVAGAGYR